MDRAYLKKVGITHVLNTAEGTKMCTVDTSADYYKEVGVKYLGLHLLDVPSANIAQYFETGAQFIDDCLTQGGTSISLAVLSSQLHFGIYFTLIYTFTHKYSAIH